MTKKELITNITKMQETIDEGTVHAPDPEWDPLEFIHVEKLQGLAVEREGSFTLLNWVLEQIELLEEEH